VNHRLRLILIAVAVFAWAGIVLSRLVNIQWQRSEELRERAERQYQTRIELTPKRGTIYDRRGRVLAINVDAPSVYAVPDEIENPEAAAAALGAALGMRESEVLQLLNRRSGFVWIRRKITPEQQQRVRELGMRGIHFVTESKRFYPGGRLAGHVLGFAGIDNNGLAGLEYQFDGYLRGQPGLVIGIRGAKGGYPFSAGKVLRHPTGGNDMTLTLDSAIQFIVEEELRAAVERTGSASGTAIVMDPATGAILAMANMPDYDPNSFSEAAADLMRNRAVVDAYEPGSTFKIVTAAAALEAGLVEMDEMIDCGAGQIQIGNRPVRDHRVFYQLPFREVIERSSNVGTIRVGLRAGNERLWRMADAFGFGRGTGIDLPAENHGVLRPTRRWSDVSIGAISIGQEVSANPVQILLMAAAVANGGYWVRPHVVAAVRDAEGRVVYEAEVSGRRILEPATVGRLRELTRGVVERGSGRLAAIPGIAAAGKTGTAEKSVPGAGYIEGAYVASFLGYLPAERPRAAVLCLLNEPRGPYYGGDVAAPLFAAIGERVARELEMPFRDQESIIRLPPSNPLPAVLEEDLGSRRAPPQGRPLRRTLAQPAARMIMPDLRGLGLREALARLAELGIVPTVEGSGAVVAQTPAPGEPVGGGAALRCGGTGIALDRGS